MEMIKTITKSNIGNYLNTYNVIVCKLRNSRIKAKQLAILEVLFRMINFDVSFISNGPLGDVKGIFSVLVPKQELSSLKDNLYGIGYCDTFYILDFENYQAESCKEISSINELYWKGKPFSIQILYKQDPELFKAQLPNNREFRLLYRDGTIKTVCGYRGNGTDTGKRALPVEDARCMVNLSIPFLYDSKTTIDIFAGGGGIVYSYNYIVENGVMYSVDIDPVLQPGLEYYGATHYTADSKTINFEDKSFDAIICEVPFSTSATNDIVLGLKNITTYLKNTGVIIIMYTPYQESIISNFFQQINIDKMWSSEINRKGTDVVIGIWCKDKSVITRVDADLLKLKTIF